MADEVIGGVSIEIRGDYSQLGADFDAAVAEAVAAGSTLADAISSSLAQVDTSQATQGFTDIGAAATEAAGQLNLFGSALEGVPFSDSQGQLNLFTDEIQQFSASASESAGSINALGQEVGQFSAEAGDAVGNLHDLAEAETEVAEHGHEAESALGSIREQLLEFGEALAITEGLHEFGVEALETFGSVQKASIALTAMTGSAKEADEAIESLKALSISDALSFPSLVTAEVRMTAFGFSADKIPEAMQAIADAAAATLNSFDKVANAFDRMALSGTAGAKPLASLGLSLKDLGDELDVTAGEAAKAFKALDVSDRLTVLTDALSKYAGVAAATAQGIIGQWQNVQTQIEFAFEGIGAALAPVVSQLLDFTNTDVLPFIQSLVDDFGALPTPVKDAAVAIGLLVASLAPLAVGAAGFGLLLTGLTAAAPAATALLAALSPIIPVVVAIGAAVALIHFEGVDTEMMKWAGDVKAELPGLADLFSPITKAISDAATAQDNFFNSIGKWIVGAPADATMAIQSQNWTTLGNAIGLAAQAISDYGKSQLIYLGGVYPQMQAALTSQIASLNALSDPNYLKQFAVIPGNVASGPLGGGSTVSTGAAQTAQQTADATAAAYAKAQASLDALFAPPPAIQGPVQAPDVNQMLAPGTAFSAEAFDAAQRSMEEMAAESHDLAEALATADTETTDIFDAAQKASLAIQAMPDYIDGVKIAWDAAKMAEESSTTTLQNMGGYIDTNSQQLDGYVGVITQADDAYTKMGTHGKNAIQQIDDAISSGLAKSLTGIIEGTTSVGKAFEALGTQVADIILTAIIKQAITPLINSLGHLLTQIPLIGSAFAGVAKAAGGGVSAAGGVGGAGGLSGLAGHLSSAVPIIGVGVAAAAGITAGIQAEHLNNLMDEVEKSTRGALNQLEDIQATLNQYLPNEVHLVDIWAQLQTNLTVLDSDLRGLALGIKPPGGAGPSGASTQVTTSDVNDNTTALHDSTLTTSSLDKSMGRVIGQLPQSQTNSFPSAVGGIPMQSNTWLTPEEIKAFVSGPGGYGGAGGLAGSGGGVSMTAALATQAQINTEQAAFWQNSIGQSAQQIADASTALATTVNGQVGGSQGAVGLQGAFGPGGQTGTYSAAQIQALTSSMTASLSAYNASLANIPTLTRQGPGAGALTSAEVQTLTADLSKLIGLQPQWTQATVAATVAALGNEKAINPDQFAMDYVKNTDSASMLADFLSSQLTKSLAQNQIQLRSYAAAPVDVAGMTSAYAQNLSTAGLNFNNTTPQGASLTSGLATALSTALTPILSSTRMSVIVNTVNPLTAFAAGVRNVGVKM